MEFTHFERVMKIILPYDTKCRSFAQRAASTGEYYKALQVFLDGRSRSIDRVATQEEIVRLFLPLHEELLGNVHHLVLEMLRRQKNKFSMQELTQNPQFTGVLSPLCVRQSMVQLHTTGHMQYHVAAHRMAGRKTYDVSPGLAERLRHTELRGLTADDLVLPFPSVYLIVPPEAELQIYNTESDWHKVVGIYITEDVDSKGCRCWRLMICGEPKPREVMGLKDDNDALIFFHVPLAPKAKLTEVVARTHEECLEDIKRDIKWVKEVESFLKNDWEAIFRWAMNIVLYTSLENAEVEEIIANEDARRLVEQMKSLPQGSKKRHRLGGRLSQMQQCQRIILGKSIQRGGWELTVRVLVTGHWRNQPHGPGRMYRRLQWIEPYWKGPDEMATATSEGPSPAPGTGGTDDTGNRKSDHEAGGARSTSPQQDAPRADGDIEGHGQTQASNTQPQ